MLNRKCDTSVVTRESLSDQWPTLTDWWPIWDKICTIEHNPSSPQKCIRCKALNCNSVAVLARTVHCKVNAMFRLNFSRVKHQSKKIQNFVHITEQCTVSYTECTVHCMIHCSLYTVQFSAVSCTEAQCTASSSHQSSFTDPETHFLLPALFLCFDTQRCCFVHSTSLS